MSLPPKETTGEERKGERVMSVGVTVELTVEDIAHTIRKLKKEDKEMLLLILSGEDKKISRRYREIKSGKVKTLSREETFRNVL